MASGNQGRPQDQGRQNGGSGMGAREQLQNVGQRMQEGAGQVGQRLREGYDTASEEAARRYRRAEGMMARNPTPSVLIGFGVGFGLGLVITTMLGERETWAERNVPDRLRKLPDSLQETLEQLADSVRNLPDTISRNLPSALTRR
jgi:ElaB/YqjD/DUF883 family membrane-anchored ribosome-binding protein